jgi:hypothetical protein
VISYIAYIRRAAMWESYKIILDDLKITLQKKDVPDVILYHGEIRRIAETKKGMLLIYGEKTGQTIIALAEMDGFEELKRLLENIQPIQPYKHTAASWGLMLLSLSAYGSFLAACLVQEREVILWLSIPALVLNIAVWIIIARNRQVSSTTKTFRFIRLLFIAVILFRLFGALRFFER